VSTVPTPEVYTDNEVRGSGERAEQAAPNLNVGLLTGGFDRPYVFGLATALASQGVCLEVIGGDEVDRPELHVPPRLKFLNLRGSGQPGDSLREKAARLLIYYLRLIRYAAVAEPKIFHILWNNKFQFFDRTVLMLYYKALGKKVAFTAHNVNAGRRDAKDSILNRFSLRVQYRVADHIFVHTEKMKQELIADFHVDENAVTVIPFGLNNSVPDTNLTPEEAKRRLGVSSNERVVLFFGAIRPYKGLEHLVAAFQQVSAKDERYRLIIAGAAHRESEQYLRDIRNQIEMHPSRTRVIQKLEFVPDEQTELYFKAADVSILPYKLVFQSGVLFLSYNFGLPVIASDVGSFGEDIVAGKTGFVCKACDPRDLARAIESYFASDLYRQLDRHRHKIREYTKRRNSWDVVAGRTCQVYASLLGGSCD